MSSIATSLIACSLLAAPALAQLPDAAKIQINAQKVAGNVYMLSGAGGFSGGNIGVSVGGDGLVFVDDQFEPLVPKIEEALRAVSDKPVRFVINTHFHSDHTHGNKAYGTKATIIAHDNVRRRLQAETAFDWIEGTRAPRHALPIITFDHAVSVHLNGEEVRGIHVPAGHTDTDTIVYFTGSKVVHMGDDFFNGMFPYIDLSHGGTLPGYIAAMERVHGELAPDVRIIPGHGPVATRSDLAATIALLKETSAIVREGIAQGRSADELVRLRVLDRWDKLSWQFVSTDFFVRQLYNGLKGIAEDPK